MFSFVKSSTMNGACVIHWNVDFFFFFSFFRAWNVLLNLAYYFLTAIFLHLLSSDKECSLENLNHFNFHLICLNHDSVIWLSLHRIHEMCFFWMKIEGGLQEFTQYTSCCSSFCQSIEPESNYCEVKLLGILWSKTDWVLRINRYHLLIERAWESAAKHKHLCISSDDHLQVTYWYFLWYEGWYWAGGYSSMEIFQTRVCICSWDKACLTFYHVRSGNGSSNECSSVSCWYTYI